MHPKSLCNCNAYDKWCGLYRNPIKREKFEIKLLLHLPTSKRITIICKFHKFNLEVVRWETEEDHKKGILHATCLCWQTDLHCTLKAGGETLVLNYDFPSFMLDNP